MSSNIREKSALESVDNLALEVAHSFYNLATINMAPDPAYLEYFGLECWPDGCQFYENGLTLAEVLSWFDGEQILNAWLAPEFGHNNQQNAPYAHLQALTRAWLPSSTMPGIYQKNAPQPLRGIDYVHKRGTVNNLAKVDTNMGALTTGEIIVKTWHAAGAATCEEVEPFIPIGHVKKNAPLLQALGATTTKQGFAILKAAGATKAEILARLDIKKSRYYNLEKEHRLEQQAANTIIPTIPTTAEKQPSVENVENSKFRKTNTLRNIYEPTEHNQKMSKLADNQKSFGSNGKNNRLLKLSDGSLSTFIVKHKAPIVEIGYRQFDEPRSPNLQDSGKSRILVMSANLEVSVDTILERNY